MPKLILKKKAEVITEYDLKNSQASMSIGSENINDLKIEDRLISMQHARIERTSNRFFIRDLRSAFGTFINGERVEDIAEIHSGDDIKVGEHSIVFDNPLENIEFSLLDEGEISESDSDNDAETITQKENNKLDEFETKIRKESLTLLRQDVDGEPNLLPYQLLTIYGPYKGKRYQLLQPDTKIGRDDKLNDIILDKGKNGEPDQSISRRHATIVHKEGSFFISDKRSKTRTYVNRQVVSEDSEIEIFPNDEVEIVSDKQSSIFRLLEDGNSNTSPPKKAGVWWVRYQPLFLTLLLIMALSFGAYFAQYGYKKRSVLTQKPAPLILELHLWSTDKSLTIQNNPVTETKDGNEAQFMPVLSDFNGDGVIDIANTNIANKPILIDGATKSQRWLDAIPVKPGSALIAADINQNYLDDLIYISNDRRVVVFDIKNEAEIWSSDIFENELTGNPVLGDFNGDELLDIAVLDIEGTVHIGFNQLLSMDWSAIHHGVSTLCPLTSYDLDKDGIDELLYGSERGIVFIIDCTQKTIKGTVDINEELNQALGTFYEDNQIRFPVGVADINGDLSPDIIISTVQGRIVAIDGATRKRLWHDVLLNELSLESYKTYPFVLGDFNGDGLKDVATCSEDGYLTAYSGKGTDQSPNILWQLKSESPIQISSLAASDLNKDYISDIIFENIEGILLVIDGDNGQILANSEQTSSVQTSPPLIADLQNDGFLDILTITQTGIAFQYKTNTQIPPGTIVWGAKYSGYKSHLSESYTLPKTNKANLLIILGLLLITGSGASTIIIKKKRTLN